MSASSPGNEQQDLTAIPGHGPPDTQDPRGTAFDHPDVRPRERRPRESGAARRRGFSGRAMTTLAVSLLFAALLIACGGESPEPAPGATGDTRTAAGVAVPTIIPTEVSTTVPTEQPARGDAGRNLGRTPVSETSRASIPTRVPEPTPAGGSREPTEPPAPTEPPVPTEPPAPTRQAVATEPPAPTAPVPTATPAAPAVDICDRQESVRVAILGELGLDLDACEEVPEEQLRRITRLEGILVQRLRGDEFHGLDNLEFLSLEAVTPDLPITARGPVLPNLKLLHLSFVPGELEEGTRAARVDFSGYSNTGLEQVEMTFTPGSLQFVSYSPWFLHRGLDGIRLRVTDQRPYGQEILKQETSEQLHLPELIIEFGPTGTDYQGIHRAAEERGESPRHFGVIARRGELPWLKRGRIDRLSIINHDPGYEIGVDTNFIEDDTDAPMYVELRGITWVHKDAFDRVRGPLTLHLDPDPGGNPHRLHFSEAVETPTGTGFLPLWSKDAPYPETPECNHGLVDIAERIFQDGWDTGRWILEASEFIGSNPEDCHTNSYVPVARVSGHEASCRGEWNTFLRTGSSNDDLYLQWERAWIHPDQPLCWTRSEHSDGTVEWEGWVRGRPEGISLPEGSPYRRQW